MCIPSQQTAVRAHALHTGESFGDTRLVEGRGVNRVGKEGGELGVKGTHSRGTVMTVQLQQGELSGREWEIEINGGYAGRGVGGTMGYVEGVLRCWGVCWCWGTVDCEHPT